MNDFPSRYWEYIDEITKFLKEKIHNAHLMQNFYYLLRMWHDIDRTLPYIGLPPTPYFT